MDLPRLHGIVPPLPTPLKGSESFDAPALARLIEVQLGAGVHGLWVLGTTARFDLLTEPLMREAAETAVEAARGRVPMVLNVSDLGTVRTQQRAALFDDLAYDYYAVLPPWYQPMTEGEVDRYFVSLADSLARPLVIYNAPWICNQLSFAQLRRLAEHPRIVGCKDVTTTLGRALDFDRGARKALGFSYLHGFDQIATSTDLGVDGFVSALSNALPELAVALWEATRADDAGRAFRLQSQFLRIARTMSFGTLHACLEALMRHRGFLDRMLPAPLLPLDKKAEARLIAEVEAIGVLPEC